MSKNNGRRRIATLRLIARGEDPDTDDTALLPPLVERAGGNAAGVLVCPAAAWRRPLAPQAA